MYYLLLIAESEIDWIERCFSDGLPNGACLGSISISIGWERDTTATLRNAMAWMGCVRFKLK